MIDFTQTKKPDFLHLVLIIAVVCLALGAITPAASALEYDWEFSVIPPGGDSGVNSGSVSAGNSVYLPGALSDGTGITIQCVHSTKGAQSIGYGATLSDFASLGEVPYTSLFTNYAYGRPVGNYYVGVSYDGDGSSHEPNYYPKMLADFFLNHTNVPGSTVTLIDGTGWVNGFVFGYISSISYSYEPVLSGYPFNVDVVDSGNDYLISVSGFDGTSLSGSAYTIAVSTYSGGYNLPLTSFPMYLGDSPVHLWTTDQTFTLPIYLSDGVTPIDYYCMLTFPADPTATGYPFWWNLTTHGSTEYPFNTTYPPVVLPTPTPLIPSDIIPDPNDLNNTVNFTGWYQDQGFEGNNITAPIYSGLRGWFNENMIPVFDFFLMPIGSLSSMISESASTSTDAISDSVDQLSIYAAPMNMVGGYVVRLVPDVVWVVVFAALSIGYVVLLIRISTGSIRDTIGRFLGRW